MGAYSNPQEVEGNFDLTQSSRNLQSMFNTIASSAATASTNINKIKLDRMAQINKTNEERKLKNDKIDQNVAETESKLNQSVFAASNPSSAGFDSSMDYKGMYMPLIAENSELNRTLAKGTSKDPVADRQRADLIFSTISTLENGAADTKSLIDKLNDAKGKSGAGGIDKYGTVPAANAMLNVLNNSLPGTKKGILIPGADGKPDINNPGYEITWTKDGEPMKDSISVKNLRKALDLGSDGGIVIRPDVAPSFLELKNALPTIFPKDDKGNLLNVVSPEFLDRKNVEKKTTKEIVSGKYEENLAKVNKVDLFNNPLIKQYTDAKAKALWLASDNSAQSIYFNDINNEAKPAQTLIDGKKNPKYAEYEAMDNNLKYEDVSFGLDPKEKMQDAYNRTLTTATPGYEEFLRNYRRLFINTQILNRQTYGAEDFTANPKSISGKNIGGKKVKVVETQKDLLKKRNILAGKK